MLEEGKGAIYANSNAKSSSKLPSGSIGLQSELFPRLYIFSDRVNLRLMRLHKRFVNNTGHRPGNSSLFFFATTSSRHQRPSRSLTICQYTPYPTASLSVHKRRLVEFDVKLPSNMCLISPCFLPRVTHTRYSLYFLILDECERDRIILLKPPGDGDVDEDGPDLARNDAVAEMNELVAEFEPVEPLADDAAEGETEPANPDGAIPLHKLFRCIHEYSPTDGGRVNVVRIVLHGLFPVLHVDHDFVETADDRSLGHILPRARAWLHFSADQKHTIYRTLAAFAADFLQKFFAPLNAQGRCTPAVSTLITPTSRTEPGPDQGISSRLGTLRRLCLARDGNRCVHTGQLDSSYLMRLYERAGVQQPRGPAGVQTEAAHIMPHSLNALTGECTDLSPSKCTVWRILDMFDRGTSQILAGPSSTPPRMQ